MIVRQTDNRAVKSPLPFVFNDSRPVTAHSGDPALLRAGKQECVRVIQWKEKREELTFIFLLSTGGGGTGNCVICKAA